MFVTKKIIRFFVECSTIYRFYKMKNRQYVLSATLFLQHIVLQLCYCNMSFYNFVTTTYCSTTWFSTTWFSTSKRSAIFSANFIYHNNFQAARMSGAYTYIPIYRVIFWSCDQLRSLRAAFQPSEVNVYIGSEKNVNYIWKKIWHVVDIFENLPPLFHENVCTNRCTCDVVC
jgi:hypothetical protein